MVGIGRRGRESDGISNLIGKFWFPLPPPSFWGETSEANRRESFVEHKKK